MDVAATKWPKKVKLASLVMSFKGILCNISALRCLKTSTAVLYFVEFFTYIIPNVANNFQVLINQ